MAGVRGIWQDGSMDVNTLAFKIVQQSIGEEAIKKSAPDAAKRGHARAAALTPERRKAIAKKAADTRWDSSNKKPQTGQ